MARVLNHEEMRKMLSERREGGQEATRAAAPTPPLRCDYALSNRPRMPQGWLNSLEGQAWMIERAEMFSRMDTGGRMNFGFLPKNNK